jgi:hypothetical protein
VLVCHDPLVRAATDHSRNVSGTDERVKTHVGRV